MRHHPESANITLDKNGWDSIEEIIKNTNKIRANQGHSIVVDLEFIEKTPPQYLYHGTL